MPRSRLARMSNQSIGVKQIESRRLWVTCLAWERRRFGLVGGGVLDEDDDDEEEEEADSKPLDRRLRGKLDAAAEVVRLSMAIVECFDAVDEDREVDEDRLRDTLGLLIQNRCATLTEAVKGTNWPRTWWEDVSSGVGAYVVAAATGAEPDANADRNDPFVEELSSWRHADRPQSLEICFSDAGVSEKGITQFEKLIAEPSEGVFAGSSRQRQPHTLVNQLNAPHTKLAVLT
ncbi:unnamed protein product [Mesocestoides corti]|uniref:Uncharacterized protein n=1 Tax=Mesocestoides corti TaxID=53468 RepID=A0A158QUY9_MESCO|nr:unnamed protein product [Mesocestoides corti]